MSTPVPSAAGARPSPLEGCVVLEVSQSLAGSFAASLLADFGASVLVIEAPGEGSAVRRAVDPRAREAWWNHVGRNKRSIAVDPRAAGGRALVDHLLARADIVLTDVGPRRWKRDPWLRRLPAGPGSPLVLDLYASGADRPDLWKEGVLAAFTPALTGMMNLTGWPDGPPVSVEAPIAEYLAAMMGTMGLLAELRARRSGRAASHVSMALHEAVQRMIEWQLPIAVLSGSAVHRNGNNFPMNAGISNMPRTRDGRHVTFSAASQPVAVRLLTMVGGEELAQDPRFASVEARLRNMDALYERINDWCATLTLDDILDRASKADVVAGPIYTADDIVADPELAERGNLIEQRLANGRTMLMSAVAPRIKGLRPTSFRPAPSIGLDNGWLLGLPGVTRRRYAAWVRSGALWAGPDLGAQAERDQSASRASRQAQAGSAPHSSPAPGEVRALPLEGLVVVELGTIIAGPFAGSLLSDLGATVIKIENPRQPDALRQSGARIEGLSIWWGVATRNKKCVSLDLKHPLGKDAFRKLIAKADVLIENYRPGTLPKLGLAIEDLQQLNPRLTVLSISGYGQDVGHSHKPGFGKIAEGLSGMLPLTGQPDRPPLFTGFSLADASTGLLGALSVCLMQLSEQPGAQIDLALYESLLRMIDFQFHRVGHAQTLSRQGHNNPAGWGYADVARMPCLRCGDEVWIQLSIADDEAPGAPHLDWSSWAAARPHRRALRELKARGIPAVAVRDGATLARDRYFRDRGDVQAVTHPVLGEFPVTGFFPKGERPPETERFNAARVGEHNDWVLREFLNLSAEDHAALLAASAV